MKSIAQVFGIQTKNLYLGVLRIHTQKWVDWGKTLHSYTSFEPPQFILVRKNTKEIFTSYTDVFTNKKYNGLNPALEHGEIGVDIIKPISSNKARMGYKEAQKVLATYNKL